ncbi:MAG: hypothetical protein Q7T68_12475 [Sphingopyxis sp.]|nr:hypothetical protein [Sphingopyxis sp.]
MATAKPRIAAELTKKEAAGHALAWRLFHENFGEVLCEADPARRMAAIERLWVRHPLIYDEDHPIAGTKAVSAAAERLLRRLGPRQCVIENIIAGEDDMYLVHWHAAADADMPKIGGCQLAVLDGERLDSLFLLEAPASRAPHAPGASARSRYLLELGPTAS